MINAIASAKYYLFAQANRNNNTSEVYYRELTEEDKVNFKECALHEDAGEVLSPVYFNVKTKEFSFQNPNKRPTFTRGGFKIENVFKTVLKATGIGFISSGTCILLGYSIVSVGKGTLIGLSIGAIKSYVDYVPWKETPIWISKEERTLARVRKPNGERFPEPSPDGNEVA